MQLEGGVIATLPFSSFNGMLFNRLLRIITLKGLQRLDYLRERILGIVTVMSLLISFLLLLGCTSCLQLPSAEVSKPAPNTGIVIGSCIVKYRRGFSGPVPGREWKIYIRESSGNAMGYRIPFSGLREYCLTAAVGGEEVPFIARLFAGQYYVAEAKSGNIRRSIGAHFNVAPDKTTYIGRLVLEIPHIGISVLGNINSFALDAKDATVAHFKEKYGNMPDKVNTDLMSFK